MVAIKPASIDGFLARPDPALYCVLVYGPDSGLVHERCAALARAAVDAPDDPFSLTRMDADELAGNPARLLDEAYALALFGGRRAIWITPGTRPIVAAIERLLSGPVPEHKVVVEAGELRKGAPLRALCERSPKAAAVPCYADGDATLGRLIDQQMSAAGLTIERQARSALVGLLGADRLTNRQEIEKLLLYAQDRGHVGLDDVDLAVADASAIALDDVVDAAFGGDNAALEKGLSLLSGEGVPASAALLGALRHALQLHRLRASARAGEAAAAIRESGWPSLHFRRRDAVDRALGRWSTDRLAEVLRRIQAALLECRRTAVLGEVLAKRTLTSIALDARRQE